MAPRKRPAAADVDEDHKDGDTTGPASVTDVLMSAARAKKARETTTTTTGLPWATHDETLLYATAGDVASVGARSAVAMFDLDDTLLASSGKATQQRRRSQGADDGDWAMWHPQRVPAELRRLHADGFRLVIYTNQKGISNERSKIGSGPRSAGPGPKERAILGRIAGLAALLDLPLTILVAIDDDQYRKPSTAGVRFFESALNGGVALDTSRSFYCGDAGGRHAGWKPGAKKDFACSDREFALNLGIAYVAPEAQFLGDTTVATAPFSHDFDPRTVRRDLPLFTPTHTPLVAADKELVLMVGWPGSGKSVFAKTHLVAAGGYVRVNQDELKTPAKTQAAAADAMRRGAHVVVDNTNPSVDARRTWIDLAKAHGYPVRVFRMNVSRDLARHLNRHRMRTTGQRRVPDIAYNVFQSKFVEPTVDEGLREIKLINFVPRFDDRAAEEDFYRFT